jgi:hypothetical protein
MAASLKGPASMRLSTLVGVLFATLLSAPAWAATPTVTARGGEIAYTDAGGATRLLTKGGGFSDPVLSPDGRTAAFVHEDAPAPDMTSGAPCSLWVADIATGKARRLFASRPGDEPTTNMESFSGPTFSVDGAAIYVTAVAWVTSGAVHRIDAATGAEQYVMSGGLRAVIRSGRYSGWLLVDRHMYSKNPEGGSYEALYAVRPDNKKSVLIPDSVPLERWLKARGATAW